MGGRRAVRTGGLLLLAAGCTAGSDPSASGSSRKRRHANGLDNLHIRFVDGSEIELITVREPGDELARWYDRFIAGGDGGAFLALDAGPVDRVEERLRVADLPVEVTRGPAFDWAAFPIGHPLHHLFFVDTHRRAPDTPEQLAHPNGAVSCGSSRHRAGFVGRAIGVMGGTVHLVERVETGGRDPRVLAVEIGVDTSAGDPGATSVAPSGPVHGVWLRLDPD